MKTLRIYCKNIFKFFSNCILRWWGALGFHPGPRVTMNMCYRRAMLLCVRVAGSGQVCWYPDSIPSQVSNDLPSCLLLRTLGKEGLGSQDCSLEEAEAVMNELGGNGAAANLCMVQGCACLRMCSCVSVYVYFFDFRSPYTFVWLVWLRFVVIWHVPVSSGVSESVCVCVREQRYVWVSLGMCMWECLCLSVCIFGWVCVWVCVFPG